MSKSFAEKIREELSKRGITPIYTCKIKMRKCKDLEKFLKRLEKLKKMPVPNIRFGMA